jgi:hypothetical protein
VQWLLQYSPKCIPCLTSIDTAVESMLPLCHGASRRHRRDLYRLFIVAVLLLITVDTLNILCHLPAPRRRVSLTSDVANREHIFIASIHWNNEKILRSHWNKAVLKLVEYFGPQNVYVSILESGSWDKTKDALRELEGELAELNVPRTIVLEDTTHEEELRRVPHNNETGWITTSRDGKELRRIPYLARLRNRVMAEMSKAEESSGRSFDKVLWLNDVVFTVSLPRYQKYFKLANRIQLSRSKTLSHSSLRIEETTQQHAPSISRNRHSTTILLPYETTKGQRRPHRPGLISPRIYRRAQCAQINQYRCSLVGMA